MSVLLINYLEDNHLNIPISEELSFLIQCYTLSYYKLADEHEIAYGIDYQQLSKDSAIDSKKFIQKLVLHLQRNVSKISCSFIFKLLFELDAKPNRISLITSLYNKDQDSRHIIACYEVMKIILEHAYKNENMICMNISRIFEEEKDSITFIIIPRLNGREQFVFKVDNLYDDNNLTILLKGIVRYPKHRYESKDQYIQRFLKIGFKDIILANIAQHPQYAGSALSEKKHNPYKTLDLKDLPSFYSDYIINAEKDFLKHKYLATEVGCSPENPSLLLLTHIRCTDISFLTKNLNNESDLCLTKTYI